MFLCPFEQLVYEIQTFLKIWDPPPRSTMFWICNSDFFDFGTDPSPTFGKSSQIFPICFFDGLPKVIPGIEACSILHVVCSIYTSSGQGPPTFWLLSKQQLNHNSTKPKQTSNKLHKLGITRKWLCTPTHTPVTLFSALEQCRPIFVGSAGS